MSTYGDIGSRTAAYAASELLTRGVPYLVLERFGQSKQLPGNSTKSVKFRRFNALSSAVTELLEGVTPPNQSLTVTDVPADLKQYGGLITITDVIIDTHEDPVLREAVDVLGEQAAQMIERMRFGVVKSGTNVVFSNGSARNAVNTPVGITTQRRAIRSLKRQNARPITRIVRSTASYGTEPISPAYVGLCHPDLEGDIRNLPGFVPAEKYGSISPWENELGKCEDVRYLTSTIFDPWADAGGAKAGASGTCLSTTGTSADVYPLLYVGSDAYGIVALKGAYAITPTVVNPKPSDSDPLGQRGHAGWKSMQTAVILNDLWMVRAEVAALA